MHAVCLADQQHQVKRRASPALLGLPAMRPRSARRSFTGRQPANLHPVRGQGPEPGRQDCPKCQPGTNRAWICAKTALRGGTDEEGEDLCKLCLEGTAQPKGRLLCEGCLAGTFAGINGRTIAANSAPWVPSWPATTPTSATTAQRQGCWQQATTKTRSEPSRT